MVDLHLHSFYSDGQHSPTELVFMAKARGMSLISLTDHDTVSGIHEAKSAAQDLEIGFIPGIEFSAKDGDINCHILGYGIDPDNPVLNAACYEFRRQRKLREARIFDYLQDFGIALCKEQVYRYTPFGRAGRSHFAQAMVQAGYANSIGEAFEKYLGAPAFSKIDRPKLPAEECIRIIRDAGGFAALAHPGLLKMGSAEFEGFLVRLADAGLEGLECFYSEHTKNQAEYYQALARIHRLIVTEGSDFHGENLKPNVHIGSHRM